ncbi:TPA: ferredoxin [Candidatus Scatousia excrementigallinarum]|uniref:Ferredoxin n=1 Tax=Candidatus Scatousia excrementigallinarum TaxID=2840935 RepID=A0A9D1JMB0_9BACT|nr:ferredoxin [Candidatus Scatousia excrementigallinarum]
MFVSVSERCVGCGICTTVSPEVFDMMGNYAIANQNKVCGNEESCLDAAISCPYSAIDIHEI